MLAKDFCSLLSWAQIHHLAYHYRHYQWQSELNYVMSFQDLTQITQGYAVIYTMLITKNSIELCFNKFNNGSNDFGEETI